ncbi:hypothetical protein [Brevibacillus reuszeri]|uniref:hypothetical protein n=1 Tax=Brevibacillus reuszeri TaxID=54915 RepID=UPI002897FABC|nr:hypothetical protein [Brevibacillus reuszeri]
MQWDYRVLKEYVEDVSAYQIIEVYYDDIGKLEGWNDNTAISRRASTVSGGIFLLHK